jgi:hypothetical protein
MQITRNLLANMLLRTAAYAIAIDQATRAPSETSMNFVITGTYLFNISAGMPMRAAH